MEKDKKGRVENSLTPEQFDAIKERGKNLLVSASAGSGKTFVMIERIKEMIASGEVGVKDILVVTFTKAAASEMKERLIKGLEGIEPKNEYILEQLSDVQTASISTLHSFCAKLLKTYFYVIGLDPSFILIDELESSALKSKALSRLIDGRFVMGDKVFFELLDIFSVNRKEDNFRDNIKKFYDYLLTQVDDERWLRKTLQGAYEEDLNQNLCAKFLNDYVTREFQKLRSEADRLGEVISKREEPKLLEVVSSIYVNLLKINPSANFEENAKRLAEFEKVKTIPTKVTEGNEDLKETVKAFKAKFQRLKELATKYYLFDSSGEMKGRLRITKSRVEALYSYTKQFKEIYDSLKRDRVALDFSDLEEYTLKLLSDRKIADEIREKYAYVFVDEYQDTNLIQEEILRRITRKDNLFMVGDVKQSIYKFRASEPEIFVQKYNYYKSGKVKENKAINLNQNFRSHQDILSFSNVVFERNMTEEFGQVNYQKDAMLTKGDSPYPKVSDLNPVKLEIIQGFKEKKEGILGPLPVYSVKNHKKEEEELVIKKAEAEGKLVVQNIKEMLNKPIYDAKRKLSRPIEYSDIALLTANRGAYLEFILKELEREKIPYTSDIELGVFEDRFVGTLRSFLELLQNPEQDMHLISVLNSFMFDFDINDLAEIRLIEPETRFFHQALSLCRESEKTPAKLRKKIKNFYAEIEKYALFGKFMRVDELILEVINKTGYLNKIQAEKEGDKSVSLIYKLLSFLTGKTYNTSLSKFLDYIKDNEIKFGMEENVGGVKVTTIHKSKGLEYPVVILVGAGQPLLKRNRGEFLISKNFGVGIDYYDNERRIKQRTLVKNAISLELDITEKEERLRLLYVALTRAVNHLVIIGAKEDEEVNVEPSGAECFLDWILPATLNSTFAGAVTFHDVQDLKKSQEKEEVVKKIEFGKGNDKLKKEIARVLSYSYPYKEVMNLPIKTSVSEILKKDEKDYFVPTAFESMTSEAAIKGLAYHKILLKINLKANTKELLEKEIDRLLKKGEISKEELALVKLDEILTLLNSPQMKEFSNSRLLREQEFIALTKLEGANSELILQGVIDLVVVTDDGIIVVDYKTNNSKREQFYLSHYKKQLDIYSEVASASLKKKVIKKLIYSFALQKFIQA